MEYEFLDSLKTILEISALIFLPVVAWMLKTIISHQKKIDTLEIKVNAEINRRLEIMERKIDTFDNKIEQKIDKLEQNLNSKIDIMTTVLTQSLNTGHNKKEK